MTFEVRLARDAAKKLTRLDKSTQTRIRERLRVISQNPYDPRIGKPLVNLLGRWSSRVGSTWRIVYRVDRENGVVNVDAIQPRGQVYKRL